MKRVAFYTLGCKVNQYETEAISEMFEKAGYRIVDFEQEADVYVINTCTVTNLSDRKSRQMIRRAKRNNEDSIVIVVGCYAQTAPQEVSEIEGVNMVVGTRDRSRIIEYLEELESFGGRRNYVEDIMKTREFEELGVDVYKERTRAFIKIQEGCNQFCTYCIIPYARGPVRSRSEENILKEVAGLAQSGYKEIVLTGIHVASYGKDIKTTSLVEIMKKVHEVEGIERIRLGSIEPTTVTEEFVEAIKGMEKLCPQFHISLQSGCDSTLKRMNRKYTTKEYLRSVRLLRDNLKDVAITTDVMVGFPGETDEEFNETYRFLEEVFFSNMHVFKYSRRKGTPAASYPNQVSPQKKEERSRKLIELASNMTLKYNRGFIGKTLPVLFEQEVKGKEGFMEGLTPNYIRVECRGNKDIEGEILDVQLKETENDFIIGEIVR
ncbi:tRNA (N(6)-L-threonylcarbamoyladenosine(37)-C(2))-methylthiotransferase MtaB [Acetivibrio mesophilus]|uniref:Threonylcarbamoyladenosine tRNA methylthiotransferase MtaB n=1 Tax=Acetivibrio mesophilus TaxID=2487273 RepID=A0A4Q0I4I8_9FIRM|nr:tRNA (N(6)-L-threonylcarbamoyladenosine(37)-C(2))-methylthiotransferase MtaB [Acetivibrio mesophilus]ODM26008.1 tRNA (N(6)-L-threonylcarbamoyladenosine(37)-C(2))-methylthiotransferase MtaB [Clostridium sp. Bc-iso-3]RXE59196.1 tRNA (N(6)-L-threonylcarbamoyladenosine(37)-C(2))-methylthiotransferase MtaB [Acetivibrio mesophilus]HHV29209.1 tRNA (N(6)-L-threonylcarbamoyladenosine(37)-C(2))-methylthiotransferase MtaB [Clostridium sp.]